jgi:RimJ/RimL family protein N-acetyltransferase
VEGGAGSHRRVVRIEPWGRGDLGLLEKVLGDPKMMEYLGGPEDQQSIAERQSGYEREDSRQFKIVDETIGVEVGWVGYWEVTWRAEQVFEIGWSVLPGFQVQGIGSMAAGLAIALAKAEQRRRFLHAFPSVDNAPSNAICRKLGFTLLEECEFEYPSGNFLQVNDWAVDLFASS